MAGKARAVSGGTISRSSVATAAELDHRAAAFRPLGDPAAEHRMHLEAGGRDHARRDRGARPGRADGHDRAVVGQVLEERADDPVRHVPRAVDVTLVALALLADVEDLDRAVRGEPLELLDVDR